MITGTIGELLVQLRLLQYGVQAAPPHKDSGNDLIAIRRNVFRAIQVKTTATENYSIQDLPELFHILAVVFLVGEGPELYLDQSQVFLISNEQVSTAPRRIERLEEFRLCQDRIDTLFPF